MGLNCGCPEAAHLADLEIGQCKEGMGQIQKFAVQRVYKTPGTLNTVDDPTRAASFSSLFAAADGSKMVVSPYLQNPSNDPGAKRTFGGGNQTLNGIPIVIGRDPSTFTGIFYEEAQKTMAAMKSYSCENVGVWLIDDSGNIGCLVDNIDEPTKYMPIPVSQFFVGDKKFGGFDEPDSNAVEWNFLPNWSDHFVIIQQSTMDFNPLVDWTNQPSA